MQEVIQKLIDIIFTKQFWLFSFVSISQIFIAVYIYELLFSTERYFQALEEPKNWFYLILALLGLLIFEYLKAIGGYTKLLE